MQEKQTPFSKNLYRAIEICVAWWPPFQILLRSQRASNTEKSLMDYRQLSQEQLQRQICKEIHSFIMQHDVDAVDIEYFMLDKLEELYNTDTEEDSTQMISKQLTDIIKDLQKGEMKKMEEMEEMFLKIKNKKPEYVDQQSQEQEYVQDVQQVEEIEEEDEQLKEERKRQEQLEAQRQKQLEDDGWTVVRK